MSFIGARPGSDRLPTAAAAAQHLVICRDGRIMFPDPCPLPLAIALTPRNPLAPATLYSVITDYGDGQVIAEHFPNRHARLESLADRAEQFFTRPGCIPQGALGDERWLAGIVAAFLTPATVSLAQSVLDSGTGSYKPSDVSLSVR